MSGRDDFYVGYAERAPVGLGRWLRTISLALLVLAVAIPALLAVGQKRFEPGTFEFGVTRSFEGVLYETPVPVLHVSEPETVGAANLLLVAFGKHGLPEFARGHHGQRVRFDGSLVYRDSMMMVEMNAPESFESLGEPGPGEGRAAAEPVGEVSLVGELVDTKCWLGVMRPATGKVHRACAIRCLEGGIPPGLLVRGDDGEQAVFVLAGLDGQPPALELEWAGRSVEVAGTLELYGEMAVVRVREARLAVPEAGESG